MAVMAVMAAMVRDNRAAFNADIHSLKLSRGIFPGWTDCVGISCIACVMLGIPTVCNGAEWRIQPYLQASETYTDNVGLTPAGQERSDFITEIKPGVSVWWRSGRSQAHLDYALQGLVYAREDGRNTVNHQLSAIGNAELVPDRLFLDAGGNISQQNISLLGPVGLGNTTGTQNLTSVRTYRVSPYIRDRFSEYANYEVRYQRDGVSTDSNSLSNSDSNKYTVNITSSSAFSRYTWGVRLYREDVKYKTALDQSTEYANLDLRYFLTPRFALTATEGYEKYDYPTDGKKPQGNYWSAGFAWQPSSLTSLSVAGGEHYYGRSYTFDFSHRSRHLLWKASYNESISTTRSNFLLPQTAVDVFSNLDALLSASIADPVLRTQVVNALITQRGLPGTLLNPVNSLANQPFLEKRADASVAWNTAKTTIVLNVFRDTRDTSAIGSQSSLLFGTNDFRNSTNIRQDGVGVLVDWAFAPKTNININVGYSNILFRDSARTDDLKFIRTGLRHQFRPKITGSLDYRHLERDTNQPNGNYKENAISAGVNIRF